MGKIVVTTAGDAWIELQILRILRSFGVEKIEISSPRGVFGDREYSVEGGSVPNLGKSKITVRESRTEGSNWVQITYEYVIEPEA